MHRLVIVLGLLTLSLVAAPRSLPAQSNEQAVETAKEGAREWLALFEDEKHEETWSEASSFFKSRIGKKQWVTRIKQTKKRWPVLDSLRSRSVVASRYTTSLPKAPDGEYVVVQYRATYADEEFIETMTMKKEGEAWRVAGYVTKPASR
jgi:hypothetical protein